MTSPYPDPGRRPEPILEEGSELINVFSAQDVPRLHTVVSGTIWQVITEDVEASDLQLCKVVRNRI